MNASNLHNELLPTDQPTVHRKLIVLKIAPRKTQDAHQLLTGMFTLVTVTAQRGAPVDGLLVRRGDSLLLILTDPPDYQSKGT